MKQSATNFLARMITTKIFANAGLKSSVVLVQFLMSIFGTAVAQNYTQYVDPMIGTGGHGHTFPGATVPFGMVQLSPDTRVDGSWDGCSGYHYSDSVIYGFSHTHLSGTGCSDYGDVMLMPLLAVTKMKGGDKSYVDPKNYCSTFMHRNEYAGAGYYKVRLDKSNILVELTATSRVGMHRYSFPGSLNSSIVIDLTHRDKTTDAYLEVENDSTLRGYRRSTAWANDQQVFFYIRFSKKMHWYSCSDSGVIALQRRAIGKNVKGLFTFDTNDGKPLLVKVSISAVDLEGARGNMEAELPGWDFEKVRKDAEAAWNKELSKIEIGSGPDLQSGQKADYKSASRDQLKTFYTALYHCTIQPNIYSDVDHRYRGRDNKIHKAEGFDYYTVFSLWDTFRAEHPLFTIIDTKRTSDFINTFIAQYEQGGKLPVWELSSNETECMIGYHCVSVIADAMIKGIKGFDYEKAYSACRHSAMLDIFGLKYYKEKGFISSEEEGESVSRTLEYAYDDWCISQMARMLKKDSDYVYFSLRAQNWKNVFDPSTGFMRPRKNGGWLTPFDPREVNNCFTEGNSWQYTFFVPQDVQGLAERMGGSTKFEKQLDLLFTTSSQTTGRDQPDISGLIGQYAHGNEPSHHMTYLYDFIGRPSKTQERVHQVLTQFYKPTVDGIIGNEDCGQMSAWYVLSSLGFYQVSPGSQQYVIGSPLFSKAIIHLENGKDITIEAKNLSDKNIYISESNFLGTQHDQSYFNYSEVMNGGKFEFVMSPTPANADKLSWGRPIVFFKPDTLVPVPIVSAKSKVFTDSLKIVFQSFSNDTIMYGYLEKDGIDPTPYFQYNGKPIVIGTSIYMTTYCKNGDRISSKVHSIFLKRPNHWKLILNSHYSPQYTADGNEGIIDGLRGDLNWRKGGWQGYEGKDFECVIDLGSVQPVHQMSAGFLQDEGAWIMMPKKVEYYVSQDGKTFTLYTTVMNKVDEKDHKVQVQDFISGITEPTGARYVKVKAYGYGKLPLWHEGAGSDSWLFIDEININ